jgi:hypothetical protein
MDLIILVIYIICMTYVISQAIFSLDNQTKVATDAKFLETQLEEKTLGEKKLKDLVGISFKFDDRYKSENQPKTLAMTMENKSENFYIYVDWDSSAITSYDPNVARRVIRVAPDKRITDLTLHQVFSVIPPKPDAQTASKLQSSITSESAFSLKEGSVLELTTPIVDLATLDKVSKIIKTPQYIKDINFSFKERRKPIEFYLRLMLRMTDILYEDGNDRFQQVTQTYGRTHYQTVLTCKFTVTRMSWVDQVPWNPQK